MSEPKRQREIDPNKDLISELPNDSIFKILTVMPLVDAVKTSILSKKWRFSWASIPKLRFSEEDMPATAEFISVVDHVLSQHADGLQIFHLQSTKSCEEALDRWFLILARHPIQEISLVPVSPSSGKYCEIPSYLFSCRLLKFVKLETCTLNIPQTFDGFAELRTLDLKTVKINGGFSRLVSSCPLLENLFLRSCLFGSEVDIEIHAPILRILTMTGTFRSVHLYTPELVVAIILPWIDCEISSAIFSCRLLKVVELDNCTINIPRTFESFAELRKLILKTVKINGGFSRLVSSGPLLENLSLRSCLFGSEVDIEIHAPNLRTLTMTGTFRSVRLHTPELVVAIILPLIDCEMSSTIFSCRLLKVVELDNCTVDIPQTFNGFAELHTLNLKTGKLNGEISRLVSNCPLLENLSLISCLFGNEVDIEIHAPKLQTLSMTGTFRRVRLYTPKLVMASILPWIEVGEYVPLDLTPMQWSLSEALGHLPIIETLILLDYFVKNVVPESPQRPFPTSMSHLRRLEIDIDLQLKKDVDAAISLFRKAPLLEQVDFTIDLECGPDKAMLDLWSSAITGDCIFKNLKTMAIRNLCLFITLAALEYIVEFAELILGTVPTLESLALYDFFNATEKAEMLLHERLLQFQRASSSKAKIIIS